MPHMAAANRFLGAAASWGNAAGLGGICTTDEPASIRALPRGPGINQDTHRPSAKKSIVTLYQMIITLIRPARQAGAH